MSDYFEMIEELRRRKAAAAARSPADARVAVRSIRARHWLYAAALVVVVWCWADSVRAALPHLTAQQIAAIHAARTIGVHYRVPDLLVAIIGEESSFCARRLGDDGRSFGCGQVQLETAKAMAGHAVSRRALIDDRRLNLTLAARYLQFCIERFGIERGIYCYNHGAPKAARASTRAVLRDAYVARVLFAFGHIGELLSER